MGEEIELEIETNEDSNETVTIESERLERLLRHEDSVIYAEEEVAEPPETSLSSIIRSKMKESVVPFLTDSLPTQVVNFAAELNPKKLLFRSEELQAVIKEVDVTRRDTKPDVVELSYVIKETGVTETKEMLVTDEEYGLLLGYLGLAPYEILNLPGKEIPLRKTKRNNYEFDLPWNLSLWGRSLFTLARVGYKLKLLRPPRLGSSRYFLTTRSFLAIAIGQFFVYTPFVYMIQSTVGLIHWLIAIPLAILLLISLLLFGLGISVSVSFGLYALFVKWVEASAKETA